MHVYLAEVPYLVASAGLHVLHIVSALYCFSAAVLFTLLPSLATAYYLDFYAATLPSKNFHAIAVVYYVIGSVHCVTVGSAVVNVLMRYLLRFASVRAWQSRFRSAGSRSQLSRVTSNLPQTLAQYTNRTLTRTLRRVYNTCAIASERYVTFKTSNANGVFLTRELVDIALQTYQAHQMCLLLPRPSLNRFYVATLVLNCWSTPIVHFAITDEPRRRLLSRLCDLVLDFVSAMGVPLILLLHYADDYDPDTGDIAELVWWNDEWFIRAMNESPLILFGSWFDVVSRVGFSVSVILSLSTLKKYLQVRPIASRAVVPVDARNEMASPTKASLPPEPKKSSRLSVVFHHILPLYGVVVMAVHFHAELRAAPSSSCVLEIRPWLIGQPSCALMELNCCKRPQATGSANEFDAEFANLDPASLASIVIRHCPHVQIQPRVQSFFNLNALKVYNSTLATWGDDAALTQKHHSRLRNAFFVRTQFANASLPAGLLSHDFPALLRDVDFSVTNLNWIAPDLHERWPPGISLCLEFSQLTEFPPAFPKAQFYTITLYWNHIRSVPAEAFDSLTYLALTGNPISALPDDVDVDWIPAQSRWLLDWTNISALPPWMESESFLDEHSVWAGRSPLCETELSVSNSTLLQTKPWLKKIKCDKETAMLRGVYPVKLEEREDESW